MSTISEHYRRVLVVSMRFHITVTSLAYSDLTDIFQMRKGLQQVYSYQALHYSWQLSSYASVTDSGYAEYTLIDSATVDDTTVVWTVLEKKSVIRRTVATDPPMDTVYSVSDTATSILYESTTGHHELRSASLVWEFPVTFQNGQTFPVFRYADSSPVIRAFSFGCPRFASADYDTLWFSSDSGLFKRSYARCFDQDEYGWATWRAVRLVTRTLLSVGGGVPLPTTLKLLQNYPNPFNPSTIITYELPRATHVILTVFNTLGQTIGELVNRMEKGGNHQVRFDASRLPSGVYFYRMTAAGTIQTRKMIFTR